MLLIKILADSVTVNISGVFGIKHEDRRNLLNQIYEQQPKELMEFK